MKWFVFYFLFYCFPLLAEEVYWELAPIEKKVGPACLTGPLPRNKEEILNLSSVDLVKINLSDQVYLDSDPAIPAKWISTEGERYGYPFALELGFQTLSFKVDFLGYFNQYLGYPGKEYAWRAQLQFPFPL